MQNLEKAKKKGMSAFLSKSGKHSNPYSKGSLSFYEFNKGYDSMRSRIVG